MLKLTDTNLTKQTKHTSQINLIINLKNTLYNEQNTSGSAINTVKYIEYAEHK